MITFYFSALEVPYMRLTGDFSRVRGRAGHTVYGNNT